jgi:hypothetical protein
MEQKYGKPFAAFKTQVEKSEKEEFQEWDDLIEWEAYELAYKDCKKNTRICEISNWKNSIEPIYPLFLP